MIRSLSLNILIVFFFLFTSCKGIKEKGDSAYISSIQKWHRERIERLKKENGWLNLVALYWLNEGENSFGSDTSNKLIFPQDKAPLFIGVITLKSGQANTRINKGIDVKSGGQPVYEINLVSDSSDNPTVLALGSLRWVLISRGGKYGIRLRDLDAPLIKNFEEIETYPVNDDWRFKAKYEPYNSPKVIPVSTIIGTIEKDTVPGELVFEISGIKYKLDPIKEGNELFIIFADKTNGNETYGAGRFLYASIPDSSGNVDLDFNKAYNPPCAFTKFATCPLPPEQNHLNIAVTAGEKTYREGH